jgi:hypothetical protein
VGGTFAFPPAFYKPVEPWSERPPGSGARERGGSSRSRSTALTTRERDYASVADASHAIASIFRQRGERVTDLDEAECDACDGPLDLLTCSQCGADAFVRTCEHGGARPIRLTDGAVFCRSCRV